MRPRLTVWPPLPPAVHVRRRARPPFPLDRRGVRVFARARQGLYHGVRALGLGPGDEVVLPAYHHGSEVEALVRAGITPRFYEGDRVLGPEEAELEGLVGPRTRALYLIHALGFPQDAERWRAWADARELLLIEDAAQAWLAERAGRPAGSLGDLAIFSLYKTVGVPDGGAVTARVPIPAPGPAPAGVSAAARRHAAWMLGRWDPFGRPVGGGAYRPEEDFALGDPGASASQATTRLVGRLWRGAAGRRRAHFRRLAEDLAGYLPGPFRRIPDGASPMAFPVVVSDPGGFIRWMAGRGIDALRLWSVAHPALPEEGFPRAAALRARVVGLPVHQELRSSDLERIVAAVRASGAQPPAAE